MNHTKKHTIRKLLTAICTTVALGLGLTGCASASPNLFAAQADTLATESQETTLTLSLADAYGDGWDGAAVVGLGGFSIFWFVIKKKKFADLLAIFKK